MNLNNKILQGLVETKTEKTYKFTNDFIIGYYNKGFGGNSEDITAFCFTKEYITTERFGRGEAREVEEYFYLIDTKSFNKAKKLVNSMDKTIINLGSYKMKKYANDHWWRPIKSTKIIKGPNRLKFKSSDEWMKFIDSQKADSTAGYLYDDEFNSWQVWYPGEEVVENIETTGYKD